jgi:hypothetical protein
MPLPYWLVTIRNKKNIKTCRELKKLLMNEKSYMYSLQRLLNKQKYQSVYPGIYAGVPNWGSGFIMKDKAFTWLTCTSTWCRDERQIIWSK